MVQFLKQKQDEFLAYSICQRVMLIAPEAQTMQKLVKDFLEEPIEKNSDYEVVCLSPHADFISGIF